MKLIEELRYWADFFKGTGQKTAAKDFNRFADSLAASGALVPVRIEVPGPIRRGGWFMTPSGLGWLAYDVRGHEYIDTPGDIYGINDAYCYPVRLVPIAEWEPEG